MQNCCSYQAKRGETSDFLSIIFSEVRVTYFISVPHMSLEEPYMELHTFERGSMKPLNTHTSDRAYLFGEQSPKRGILYQSLASPEF